MASLLARSHRSTYAFDSVLEEAVDRTDDPTFENVQSSYDRSAIAVSYARFLHSQFSRLGLLSTRS